LLLLGICLKIGFGSSIDIMSDKSPWHEENQERLARLKAENEKLFLQWNWYCREVLNLNPSTVPIIYLERWLKLPPAHREMGY